MIWESPGPPEPTEVSEGGGGGTLRCWVEPRGMAGGREGEGQWAELQALLPQFFQPEHFIY